MHSDAFHKQKALTRRSVLGVTGLTALAAAVGSEALFPVQAAAASTSPARRQDLLPNLTQRDVVTVIIRFTAPQDAAGALLSATSSDKTRQWSVLLGGGAVHLRASAPNLGRATQMRFPLAADRRGHLDDGNQHWVAVRISPRGTDMFVDGQWAHASTAQNSPHSVGGLTLVTQGAVGGAAGDTEVFPGAISDVIVSSQAMSSSAIAATWSAPDTETKWTPDRAYTANRPLTNRLSEAPAMTGFASGTLYAEFQTKASGVMSIVCAGDTTQDSTDLTVALNGGALVIEHRVKGNAFMNFTVPGTWNDGRRHSVCLTTSPFGTIIYADGSEVERHSCTAFLQALTGMNGLWIGGNVDSSGEQWKFIGTIGQVKVFDWALSPQQVATVSHQPVIESLALFDNGFAQSANYRIPSLLMTSAGVLIAAADQRTASAYDSPNHIQTVVRRSTDQGETWGDVQVVVPQPGSGNGGASSIDSVLVEDTDRGNVVLVVDRFPGGTGQGNAAVGTGFDSQGRKILTGADGASYRLLDDGSVITDQGGTTPYRVAQDGSVTHDGQAAGNIHLQSASDPNHSLSEHPTAYMVLSTSHDQGVTWSAPRDITAQVKAPWMRFIGTGPGSAIRLRTGALAGRLMVPIYYNNDTAAAGIYSSAVIYSDDGGATWTRSASPNDGRVYNGKTLDSRTLNVAGAATHEPTIAQLDNGDIVMFMRNRMPGGRVLRSVSTDSGQTWSAPHQLATVPDIFSEPNAIAIQRPGDTQHSLAFSNASKTYPGQNNRSDRGRGVLRISTDGGINWPRNRTFRADNYVYSSMAQLRDGSIGLMWEMEWDGIYFARVPLSWIETSCML